MYFKQYTWREDWMSRDSEDHLYQIRVLPDPRSYWTPEIDELAPLVFIRSDPIAAASTMRVP